MTTGLFGGTFNPPHRAHIEAAGYAKDALSLDRVMLIPSALPPHKQMPEASPLPAQRLEMCRLAVKGMAGFEVSDIEIRRGGPSFTVDTLAELKLTLPSDEFWLLMGQDMALILDKWHKAHDLHKYCRAGVLIRGDVAGDISAAVRRITSDLGLEIRILDNLPIDLSSTRLRSLGREGMRGLVCDRVYEYIAKNHLY